MSVPGSEVMRAGQETPSAPNNRQVYQRYSSLHLYEEVILGFPLPLWERDRVRGKVTVTSLFIQTKSAVNQTIRDLYTA